MQVPAFLDPLVRRLEQSWRERAVSLKALSFAVVGVVNTVVDYGVFLAAYYLLELPLIPANVLALLIAVAGSYRLHSCVTFAAASGRQLRWRSYGAFVASGVAGLVANTATLVAFDWLSVPVPAAKLLAIAASFVVNFSLSHFVVFRTRQRPAGTSAE